MVVIDFLQEIGLTKSEIKVYLALLELGSSTTGPIVEKSQASSSKIYEILEKLMQKGLVSFVIKSGTKYFEAANPERLMDYMKEKKDQLTSQEKRIEQIIPELKLKQTLAAKKSEATVFKGQRGVETAYRSILNQAREKDDVVIFAAKPTTGQATRYNLKWNQEMNKRVKRQRLLYYGQTKENLARIKEIQSVGCEVRIIPTEQILPISTIIFRNIIFNTVWSEDPITFKIENKTVADSYRANFELLWNQETTVVKGFDQTKETLFNFLDEIKNSSYDVIGAAFGKKGIEKNYVNFFKDFHTQRIKNHTQARLLFQQSHLSRVSKDFQKQYYQRAKVKTLSYQDDSPVEIFMGGNKTLLLIQEKEPTVITINNKEITQSFLKHFETLWNQETTVVKGFKAMLDSLYDFVDEINPGDTFNALGATFGIKGNKQEYADSFKKYHDYRIKKGIKARLLFQPSARKTYEKNKKNYGQCDVRFLPYDTDSPVSIHPYKNKTMMIIQEKEPTVITINNKEITQSFLKHFETLWNQETKVLRGLDAVQQVFEEMLESSSCDFIGARGYFIDKRKKYFEKWKKLAIAKGFTMRNIVDISTKNHPITKLPFAKTKYTLPKEFAELSVFWIYGNKVVISNWMENEPIITVIENEALNKVYRKQFELLWKKKIN